MQFVDTAHHGQIVRSGDRLGAVDPRARQAQQHALAAHRQVVARPSTIARRLGALIALASWPRNPVRPSVGRSWRKAWPSRARAPPRHPPNCSPLGRIGSPHVENLLLPSINLVRMHPVPLRQLRTVASSRSASSAIFALNVASNFCVTSSFLTPSVDRAGHSHQQWSKWGAKGFGFIQPDAGGPDVFVHISAVERAGIRDLNEGQKIAYEIVADKRTGKSSADNLKPV